MASSPLYFIHPRVLKRLRSGTFVPSRKTKNNPLQLFAPSSSELSPSASGDRRHVLSPLAITKRCIPYQPAVFFHRRDTLLEMAEHLNSPHTRVLLLNGDAGIGKTSAMRGLVEMMGSEDEQVLWFDINPHSTVDDMVRFFIEYLEKLSHLFTRQAPDSQESLKSASSQDRLKALRQQFQAIAHIPILIVLDHIEHQVDHDGEELRSNTLRELLNFLLGFSNLKLCLVGQSLPFRDISAQPPTIIQQTLGPLPPSVSLPWMHQKSGLPKTSLKQTDTQWRQSMGNPWQLNAWLFYQHQHILPQEQALEPDWFYHLLDALSPDEHLLATIFTVLRHPVNLSELAWLVHHLSQSGLVLPDSQSFVLNEATLALKQCLKSSRIRPWLKRFVPPQTVLLAMYKGNEPTFKPAHEFQMSTLPLSYFEAQLNDVERQRVHERLSQLYLKQKEAKKGADHNPRILSLSNAQLIHEARYHQEQAQSLATAESISFSKVQTSRERPLLTPSDLGDDIDSSFSNDRYWEESPFMERSGPTGASQHAAGAPPIIITSGAAGGHPELEHTLTPEEWSALGLPEGKSVQGEGVETLSEGTSASIIHVKTSASPLHSSSQPLTPEKERSDFLVYQETDGALPSKEFSVNDLDAPEHSSEKNEGDDAPPPSRALLHYRRDLQEAVTRKDDLKTRQALFALTFQAIADQHQPTVSAALKQLYNLSLSSWEKAHVAYAHGLMEKQQYQYRNAFSQFSRCEALLTECFPDVGVPSVIPETLQSLPLLAQLEEHRGDMHTLWENPDQAANHYARCIKHLQSEALEGMDVLPQRRAEIYFKWAQACDANQQHEAAWNAYHESIQWNQKALEQPASEPQAHPLPTYALASAHANLAHLCAEHQQWSQAQEYFTQALHYDTVQGNVLGQFDTLLQLGHLALKQEDGVQAAQYYQQALTLAQRQTDLHQAHQWQAQAHQWQAQAHQWLAQASQAQGLGQQANHHNQRAKQLAPELFIEYSRRHTLYELTEDTTLL